MKNIKNTIRSAFFAVTLLLLSSVVAHAGFGISPADFNVDFLQPGSTYTRSYVLSRSGDIGDTNIVVEPDMGVANNWLTFSPGKIFTFKRGVKTMEFKVTINVPETAEYKQYPGTFTLRAIPADAEVKGVTIAQGLQLDSDIEVTKLEIINLAILNIKIDDIEIGNPVIVKVTGENKGNVNSTPTLKLTLMDLNEEMLEQHDLANLQTIESGVTKEVTGQFTTELEIGEYYVDVEAFLGEESLRKERMVLTITAKKPVAQADSTKDKGTAKITSFIEDNKDYLWIIAAAALVGLLVLVLISVFWTSKERSGKKTDDIASIAGGSKRSTRVTLSIAVGLLTTFAILSNISSGAKVNVPIVKDPGEEVQGTSDTKVVPKPPMLNVVESVVKPNNIPYPVYESADEESEVIYEAKEDEQLEVVRQSGNWYQVKLPTGKMGWVSRSIVKFETTKNQ